MQTLDFYQAYLGMSPTEKANYFWALKKIRRLDLSKDIYEHKARGLFIFCISRTKTRKSLVEAIKRTREIPSEFFEAFAEQFRQPTVSRILIGTRGKFVLFQMTDGTEKAAYDPEDAEEVACYQITRMDLENSNNVQV